MSKDMSPPAFPLPGIPGVMQESPGMSLRDYFAAQALSAGIIKYGFDGSPKVAELAYEYADAMIKERSK